MDLPTVNKMTNNVHVLMFKEEGKYYDGHNDTSDILEAVKFHGYTKALKSKNSSCYLSDCVILKVKITCEILEVCE